MRRRSSGALVGIAVVLAVLWWRREEPRNQPANPGEGSVAITSSPPVQEALRGGEREPAATSAIPRGSLDGVLVDAVDADTGAPVPGADVFLLWIDADRERALERKRIEDILDEVEEEGERGRTDGQGTAYFPVQEAQQLIVVARHGSRWGAEMVDEHDSGSAWPRLRVELVEDFDVTVRVLDYRGRPARDVPLSLACERLDLERKTDSDGEAEFEHIGALRSEWPELEWTLSADIIAREPIRRDLGRITSAGTILLHLPPTGSVQVRVEDADGEPVQDGAIVGLHCPEVRASETAKTTSGLARFAQVQIGLELETFASRRGGPTETSGRFEGPRQPDETVEQRILFGTRSSVLPLRVRRPDGRNFTSSLDVQIQGDTGRVIQMNLHPGSDGAFRLDLAQQAEEAELLVLLDGWAGRHVGARLELSLPLPSGVLAEREILLEDAPVLLGGRIVDIAGRPILSEQREDGTWDGVELEYRVAVTHKTTSLHTDHEGRFEVRSFHTAQEIAVRVTRWSRGGELVRVPPGSTDLVLVLDERE